MSDVVRPGVRPDRAADRARDRQPELESGQPRLLGLGRGPGHRRRRPRPCSGRPRRASPRPGPGSTRPRTPRSLMTTSLPRPSTRCGSSRARANRTSAAQLEHVVHGREQVGRAADPHRREARQRLVARGLDADAALDVRPDGDRVEGAPAVPSRGRPARPLFDDAPDRAAAREPAAASTRSATASAAPGRPSARAAAAISRCAAGSSSSAAASSSASASKASSSTSRAAPASTSARALARW